MKYLAIEEICVHCFTFAMWNGYPLPLFESWALRFGLVRISFSHFEFVDFVAETE